MTVILAHPSTRPGYNPLVVEKHQLLRKQPDEYFDVDDSANLQLERDARENLGAYRQQRQFQLESRPGYREPAPAKGNPVDNSNPWIGGGKYGTVKKRLRKEFDEPEE